jgi:hypothetical protein
MSTTYGNLVEMLQRENLEVLGADATIIQKRV